MFKINTGQLTKVLFYGFSNLNKYWHNIQEGRKRTKSIICIAGIIIGAIIGLLTPLVFRKDIPKFVANTMDFDPNWFITVCTVVSFASFGSSLGFLFAKISYRQYNYCRYGYSNKQYSDLTASEIKTIVNTDWNLGNDLKVDLTATNVKNVHSQMIEMIKAHKGAGDRHNLKTAHLRFRRGEVKYSLMTQPPILAHLISQELINNKNKNAARAVSELYTPLAQITDVIQAPQFCTVPRRLERLTKTIETVLSELNDLKNLVVPEIDESEHDELDQENQEGRMRVSGADFETEGIPMKQINFRDDASASAEPKLNIPEKTIDITNLPV